MGFSDAQRALLASKGLSFIIDEIEEQNRLQDVDSARPARWRSGAPRPHARAAVQRAP